MILSGSLPSAESPTAQRGGTEEEERELMQQRRSDDDSGARTATQHRELPAAALAPVDAATAHVPARRGSTAPCERAVDARLVAEASIRGLQKRKKRGKKMKETQERLAGRNSRRN